MIHTILRTVTLGATLALTAVSAHAQYLMVCDGGADRVLLASPVDGSVVDPNFITDDVSGINYALEVPFEAVQVDDEVWVTDQASDQIVRFDIYGSWRATISGQLDNLRGLTYANGLVYVLNGGTANGAPGKRLIVFDRTGTRLTQYSTGDAYDVIEHNGRFLTSNIFNDDLQHYSFGGVLMNTFHASDGITGVDFPTQLSLRENGNVLAGGLDMPYGIYEYDVSGAQQHFYPHASSVRGMAPLANGLFLISDVSALRTYDPATAQTTVVLTNFVGGYITPLNRSQNPTVYCSSGTTSSGCVPSIAALGTASASATSGFTVRVDGVEGQRLGVIFYGRTGRLAVPWGVGSTSWMCVRMPTQRMDVHQSSGTPGSCDGALASDWSAFVATHALALGAPYYGGEIVDAQGWFRDPFAPKGTNMSDALEFTVLP